MLRCWCNCTNRRRLQSTRAVHSGRINARIRAPFAFNLYITIYRNTQARARAFWSAAKCFATLARAHSHMIEYDISCERQLMPAGKVQERLHIFRARRRNDSLELRANALIYGQAFLRYIYLLGSVMLDKFRVGNARSGAAAAVAATHKHTIHIPIDFRVNFMRFRGVCVYLLQSDSSVPSTQSTVMSQR